MAFLVVHEDENLRLVTSRNVLVAVWTDAPTVAQMHTLERAARRLGTAHRETGFANVAVRGTPSFSSEVREEVLRLSRNPKLLSLARAHVIIAPGLVGAAVRAFLSTTLLLARVPVPTKVLSSFDAAAAWLVDPLARGDTRWTREELLELLQTASAR